ncbi:hypothetical protein HZA57_07370, partial [Candidatus Poribacteria bacterium]|nr:hypothetical protein [Candidatus Poribacteria bacterium]
MRIGEHVSGIHSMGSSSENLTPDQTSLCLKAMELLGITSAVHSALTNQGHLVVYLRSIRPENLAGRLPHGFDNLEELSELLQAAGAKRLRALLAKQTASEISRLSLGASQTESQV